MKNAQKKLQDLIKEELLHVLNEKVDLTGIIIKFNANQPGQGHPSELESTKWLEDSPFKFRDVVIPGNPAQGDAVPTQDEEDVWNMIVSSLIKNFEAQGVKDEDMNINMPMVVIIEDIKMFPNGNNAVHIDWDKDLIAKNLLDPRFRLQYKEGFSPDADGKRGGGSADWFVPVAKTGLNESLGGSKTQFAAIKAGTIGGAKRNLANIKDPIARKVLCVVVSLLAEEETAGCFKDSEAQG